MRILLVRLDGIGDALACTPLVAALRDGGHELGVALTTRNAAVFALGTFAWTHVLERNPWPAHGHAPADVARTLEESKAIGYDVALIASEEPDAYTLGRAVARRTVGFVNGWEKPLKTLMVRRQLDRAILRPASPRKNVRHEAVTLFALGEGLTAETEPSRDAARLRPLIVDGATLDRAGRHGDGRYVALQLTPKWAAMGIAHAQLAQWARELREIAPVRLLVSGDEAAEMQAVGDVLDTDVANINATVFAGEDGLRAWKRAIADAAAIVTPDTGAAHVAGMTGTACVDVFPAGPLAPVDMQRWSPWVAPNVMLEARPGLSAAAEARALIERACAPS